MENGISFLIGRLAGSLLLVAIITILLKSFVFRKQESTGSNCSSVFVASLIGTIIYALVSKEFSFYYLISGIILFIILEIKDKNKKEIAIKKTSAVPGKCHNCGHKQDTKLKYCQKCSEEMA